MFLGTLYTILKQDKELNGRYQFQLSFNASHALYEGHFPNHPITPGVVWMEIVKELWELSTGTYVHFNTVRQCKFLQAHNPFDSSTVSVFMHLKEGEQPQLIADANAGEVTYFKLNATI